MDDKAGSLDYRGYHVDFYFDDPGQQVYAIFEKKAGKSTRGENGKQRGSPFFQRVCLCLRLRVMGPARVRREFSPPFSR